MKCICIPYALCRRCKAAVEKLPEWQKSYILRKLFFPEKKSIFKLLRQQLLHGIEMHQFLKFKSICSFLRFFRTKTKNEIWNKKININAAFLFCRAWNANTFYIKTRSLHKSLFSIHSVLTEISISEKRTQ